MSALLQTRWQAMDLIVSRDGQEVDRVGACDIERIILVYRDRGDTPGDLAYAVLQTREHDLLFPPESGIAGRVHIHDSMLPGDTRVHPGHGPDTTIAALPSLNMASKSEPKLSKAFVTSTWKEQ